MNPHNFVSYHVTCQGTKQKSSAQQLPGGSMGNVIFVKFKDTFYIIHIHIANRKLHDTY